MSERKYICRVIRMPFGRKIVPVYRVESEFTTDAVDLGVNRKIVDAKAFPTEPAVGKDFAEFRRRDGSRFLMPF